MGGGSDQALHAKSVREERALREGLRASERAD
jgi:hypothetical protein